MSLHIRRASVADAAVLAALEAACFGEAWPEAVVASDLAAAISRAWLAEADGRAVGYLLGSQILDEFTISRVASVPEARRTGVGRALVAAAFAGAKDAGGTAAFLEVRASNSAAITLYESFGFVTTRRRKGYYGDGEDALDMRAELS